MHGVYAVVNYKTMGPVLGADLTGLALCLVSSKELFKVSTQGNVVTGALFWGSDVRAVG